MVCKKIIAFCFCAVMIALCAISPALALDVNLEQRSWAYDTGDGGIHYLYTSQLAPSQIPSSTHFLDFVAQHRWSGESPISDISGDFVQCDIYYSFGAPSPSWSDDTNPPFFQAWYGTLYDSMANAFDMSYYSPISRVSTTYTRQTSQSGVISFTMRRAMFEAMFQTQQGTNNHSLTVLWQMYGNWWSTASSNQVLMFNTFRVTTSSTVIPVDSQILGTLQDVESAINEGVLTLSEGQQEIEQAINDSAEQEHQDFLDVIQEMKNQFDREKQENQDAVDGAQGDGQEQADEVFDNTSFLAGARQLYDALTYSGTDFSFKFPDSGDVPFLGHLWNEIDIPFREYIDNMPYIVIWILRGLLFLGTLYVFIHYFHVLLDILNGGSDDDEF